MSSDAAAPSRGPWLRLIGLLLVVIGLSAAGLWWAAPQRALRQALEASGPTSARFLVELTVAAALVLAVDALRLMVHGRAFGARVTARTAFAATIGNNFMSWLTPGSALGEPAAAYLLGRAGIGWDVAILIAYLKFVISFAVILVLTAVGVGLGYSPRFPPLLGAGLAVALAIFAVLAGMLILAIAWPARARRLIERSERWLRGTWLGGGRRTARVAAIAGGAHSAVARLVQLRTELRAWLVPVLACHLAYYAAYAAIMVVIARHLGQPGVLEAAARGLVYLGFLYILPTPGGAGFGEAAAGAFFTPMVGAGAAVAFVLWFRVATLYLHVVLGLLYLPLHGALAVVVSGARRPVDPPPPASPPTLPG